MNRVILGRKGSGKSRLARLLLSLDPPKWLAIIDPLNEHWTLSPSQGGQDWIPRLQAERWPVRIHPRNQAEYRLALAALAARNDWHLFNDEVDRWENAVASDELAEIIDYGRHRGQSSTFVARRPAAMPRLATSQADELWIFTMWEPLDCKYVRDYAGIHAKSIPVEEVWRVRTEALWAPERYTYDRAALTLRPVNGGGNAAVSLTGTNGRGDPTPGTTGGETPAAHSEGPPAEATEGTEAARARAGADDRGGLDREQGLEAQL